MTGDRRSPRLDRIGANGVEIEDINGVWWTVGVWPGNFKGPLVMAGNRFTHKPGLAAWKDSGAGAWKTVVFQSERRIVEELEQAAIVESFATHAASVERARHLIGALDTGQLILPTPGNCGQPYATSDDACCVQAGLTPPGWLPDGSSGRQLRYWDGSSWTAHVNVLEGVPSRRPITSRERYLAALAHLLGVILPVVGALFLRFTAGLRAKYVGHHAAESASFQVALPGLLFVLIATPGVSAQARWVLVAIVCFLYVALCAFGAVQALRGEWWRYPVPWWILQGPPRNAPISD